MEEMRRVMFADKDHVWVDGNKQFISLNRFLKLKGDMLQERKLLMERIYILTEENNSLWNLLNSKGGNL